MSAELAPPLWLLVPSTPLLVALLLAWRRARPAALALAPFAALPGLLLALMPPASLEMPSLFLGARFALSTLERPFLLFTALVWLLAGLYARSYLEADPARVRYFTFHLLTLAGNLGLIVAGDVVTFYVGFALMTYSAYGLVVHEGTLAARRAGRVYVSFAASGEVLLLAGLLVAASHMEGLALRGAPAALAASTQTPLVSALLVVGLGVKAGALGLHVWLPLAHPVAPTPASALLSGAMIKAGLLGWLLLLPLGEEALFFAPALVVVGFVASLYAAAMGLTQRDSKTVLAYSSVSQMGLVTMLVGAAMSEPAVASVAAVAAMTFALHHGLAKCALFLSVGVVRRQLGPRARRLCLVAAALPALSLGAVPLTSGAAAKAGLKETLESLEGAGFQVFASVVGVTSVATLLLLGHFLARVAAEAGRDDGRPREGMVVPWLTVTLASVLAPLWLLLLGGDAFVAKSLSPAAVGQALWPLLVAALALWLARLGGRRGWRLPALPAGDIVVGFEAAARTAAWQGRRALQLLGDIYRIIEAGAARLAGAVAHAGAGALAFERQLNFTTGLVALLGLALLFAALLL